MILISQWYEPADEQRRKELEEVRAANTSLGVFKKVVYEDGRDSHLSFNDLLSFANREFPGEVCVVANTDIVFDWSAVEIDRQCRPRRLVTLTRWERDANCPRMLGYTVGGHFFSGTLDSWAFVSGEMPELKIEIPLGFPGCDQAIAGWAVAAECEVVNPSYTVVTRHLHSRPNDYTASLAGFFAYPEIEVASSSPHGLALCHVWDGETAESIQQARIVRTCRQ